jgi:hypothetical protein
MAARHRLPPAKRYLPAFLLLRFQARLEPRDLRWLDVECARELGGKTPPFTASFLK